MDNKYLNFALQRVLLPSVLGLCILIRPVGISFVYLIMFVLLPFISVPTSSNWKVSSRAYYIILIALSSMIILCHIGVIVAVQVLQSMDFLNTCTFDVMLLRHIGFVYLDILQFVNTLAWVWPDLTVLIASVVIYVVLKKVTAAPPPSQGIETAPALTNASSGGLTSQDLDLKMLAKIGSFSSLTLLFLAAAIRPSVQGGFYLLIFLFAATLCACYRVFSRGFAVILRLVSIVVVLHVIVIITYQTPWPQVKLPSSSLIARLLALEPLVISKCNEGEEEAHEYIYNKDLKFNSFINPFVILFCYYVMSLTSDCLMHTKTTQTRCGGFSQFKNDTKLNRQVSLIRQPTKVIRKDIRKKSYNLMLRTSKKRNDVDEALAAHQNDEPILEIIDPDNEKKGRTTITTTVLYQMWYGLLSTFDFVYKNSYIFTNIIMMVWSIVYHSWLTFVFLIWANILWMIPNQRKAMLRASPLIVFYAELLLAIQYIYGMDLLDSELPAEVDVTGINLNQIGLVKARDKPFVPLLVKTLFTLMFWFTLRQLCKENAEKKKSSTIADMVAPLQLTVGAATANLAKETEDKKHSVFFEKLGNFIKISLIKMWIWLLLIAVFISGLIGTKMTGFRICYMALFLFFTLAFQCTWRGWLKVMYGFWLFLIFYGMTILILIYTYQFDRFDQYWHIYLNISESLQKDIGLEKYKTKDLFLHLLTPTVIVIMTIIQIHYFHKRFVKHLKDEIGKNRDDSRQNNTQTDGNEGPSNKDGHREETVTSENEQEVDPNESNLPSQKLQRLRSKIDDTLKDIQINLINFKNFLWTFLELHLVKVIFLTGFIVSLEKICAVHIVFVGLCVIPIMLKKDIQIHMSRIMSVGVSILILATMIYQVDYINHEVYNTQCMNSTSAPTFNNIEWFGFEKISASRTLIYLLRGYVAYMVVTTLYAVVVFRQEQERASLGHSLKAPKVIFPDVTVAYSDKDLNFLLKYLVNYGFFRLGFEISLIALVIVIASTRDVTSVLYAVWLGIFFILKRNRSHNIWIFFQCFVAFKIIVGYLLYLGFPPSFCAVLPWEHAFNTGILDSKILPDPSSVAESGKLIADFILLLLITCQMRVFRTEKKFRKNNIQYPGGDNTPIVTQIHEIGLMPFNNPIHDYRSSIRNWLDVGKMLVFVSFFWITLAMVFLAGTHITSIFSVGYLAGSFFFLWQGTDFYLRPIRVILRSWNMYLTYNVIVILLKTVLRIGVCIFSKHLGSQGCWLMHMFGIGCNSHFTEQISEDSEECIPMQGISGLTWDAACFSFLIIQLRIFNSYYFCHIIEDTKVSAILASRGAVLIEDLRQKQIQHRNRYEKEVLRKIKAKMEKIRATQQKMFRPMHKQTHFDEFDGTGNAIEKSHGTAIRAGDYYMFEDVDEKIELSLMDESADFLEDAGKLSEREKNISKRKGLFEDETPEKETPDSPDKPSSSKEDSEKPSDEPADKDQKNVVLRITEGILVTLAVCLNRLSRNYIYIMRILSSEKNALKESRGIKTQDGEMWSYFTRKSDAEAVNTNSETNLNKDTLENQSLSSSSDDVETDTKTITIENEGDTKDNTHRKPTNDQSKKLGRKSSVVPEIRVLAPSMERGLDASSIIDSVEKFTMSESDSLRQYAPDEEFSEKEHSIFVEVLISGWYAILSNTDIICYLFIFINQIASSSILSLPLPLMVFIWGTLSIPRPTKSFWITLIAYTQCIVLIKCIFQFKTLWFPSVNLPNQPLSADKIIGIEPKENYATYDLLVLLALFFHRFILKSQGLWDSQKIEQTVQTGAYIVKDELPEDDDSGSFEDVQQTASITKGKRTLVIMAQSGDVPAAADDVEVQVSEDLEDHRNIVPAVVKVTSAKYFSPLSAFFKNLLHKARLPTDIYALMFMCDFVNFFVLLFGFTAFGSPQRDGGVQTYLSENKVPIPFLIMLLIQFVLIIIDRALYLRKALILKIAFHFLSVIGIHIWMFFIIPAITERNFNVLIPPVLYYVLKCIYFLFSSYQIRCGYPKRILGNFLTRAYTAFNMVAFKLYKIVPFLYELRTFLDWVCTDTTMTLWEWLKMEDIFSDIFFIKCTREMEKAHPTPRAKKKEMLVKIFMGGSMILVCVIIIWAPLTLFAVFTAVGESNIPTDVSLSITIGPYLQIYEAHHGLDEIYMFDQKQMSQFQSLYLRNKTAMTFLTSYDPSDVAAIALPPHSQKIWEISPPDLDSLINHIIQNRTLMLRLKLEIGRQSQINDKEKDILRIITEHPIEPGDEAREKLIEMLQGKSPHAEIVVPQILPKFLQLKNSGNMAPIPDLLPDGYGNIAVTLSISRSQTEKGSEATWWNINEICNETFYAKVLANLPLSDCGFHIAIYTFNDKKFPKTFTWISAGGIIGMYTSFVLLISRVLRGVFFDSSRAIMYTDLPYVDRVLQLCLDVYLVREAKEYALEEDLFAKLIFLYRSPETMIKWTRPREENAEGGDESESRASRRRVD